MKQVHVIGAEEPTGIRSLCYMGLGPLPSFTYYPVRPHRGLKP